MKRLAALTVAGASLVSIVALQRRGILPRVQWDQTKARQVVKLTRDHGKHETGGAGDDNL